MAPGYWEFKHWFDGVDYTIVGGGLTGLSTAIRLKSSRPDSRVLLLERSPIPQGASTKNAGFACFGSPSELLMDLDSHEENEVVDLVRQRWEGIGRLRKLLGDSSIGYEGLGSQEVFLQGDTALLERCLEGIDRLNRLLRDVFGDDPFRQGIAPSGFRGVSPISIQLPFEGQLNPVSTITGLGRMADSLGILRLNGWPLEDFEPATGHVRCRYGHWDFNTRFLCLATNGFAHRWFPGEVRPARAQVLVTEPLGELGFEGTFHIDKGYTYFRNVGGRLLLGGGRQLDFLGEETDTMETTPRIQEYLERLIREVILPGREVRIERRWSGIMGVGPVKRPLLKEVEPRVFAAVRLGGMGVALGVSLGEQLAGLVLAKDD